MSWMMWALLSAIFAAATALLAKFGVAGVDPNLATAVRTTVVVLFAWAIAIGFGAHDGLAHIERRSWIFLTLSGFATGLSWICYFRALSLGRRRRLRPSTSSASSSSSCWRGHCWANASHSSRLLAAR